MQKLEVNDMSQDLTLEWKAVIIFKRLIEEKNGQSFDFQESKQWATGVC